MVLLADIEEREIRCQEHLSGIIFVVMKRLDAIIKELNKNKFEELNHVLRKNNWCGCPSLQ